MAATTEAANSGKFDAVVAAGGDGTIHDVAEGVLGKSVPLGIIPLGTGNVYARELGIGFSAEKVAQILLEGEAQALPVGQINGRAFLFAVGVGFDAEAVRHFEAAAHRAWGQAGFVLPVLQALASDRSSQLSITTDHGQSNAHWVIVTRAKRYAGGLKLADEADVTKTALWVVRFEGHGAITRSRQLAALALGLVRYDPAVWIEPAAWVRIEGADRPIQVDGELLEALPLALKAHSLPLNVILPALRTHKTADSVESHPTSC
jgi:YegS/Rv2252/BmrU family lipid kinase